ncbi:MAG: hypothetical protein GQ540_08085 [Lutibacter sp.]|uniref:hypothetical protein n=1 Tax=Lutibacter sp. TaxID=1925666 RepID=UPI0019F2E862|nr:hypothetical protein [Lutibacter sp.]NOR28471.1 hypothetical protein [Lutibacter sp.]
MKTLLIYLIIFLSSGLLFSQNENPTEALNGTYHLLEAERAGGNKQTNTKIFQYGKWGEDNVLAVAACAKCMPAIYKYKEEYSKDLKTAVFYNDIGLFLIAYDSESFVMMMPSKKEGTEWTDFAFSNFYSKNQVKVAAMTQHKIKEFIIKISE